MGRRILVCEFDIFQQVGGGQTVYQNIIRKCPDDIFYYFMHHLEFDPARPKNAVGVPFRQFYNASANALPPNQGHFFHVYSEAMDMARSLYETLGEVKFDVVDTPDYRQNGLFIRHALELHGISVGIVALALHGTLSSALTLGWPWSDDPSRSFEELRLREHLQFRIVDARYAISEFYTDALQRYARFPVNMLDPLAVIRETQPFLPEPESRAADLLFIGRRERRKGPDLFVDFAWWLPRDSYRRLIFIGDDGTNHQGAGSQSLIDGMARRRRLNLEFMPSMAQSELQGLIRQKSLVLVTSRYDQFNLVALEALLDGCPTVISRHAGVCQFVQQRLPDLSWLLCDITCDRTATAQTREILENYESKRSKIVEVLQRVQLSPDLDSLQHIYDPADKRDLRTQGIVHDLADRFALFSIKRTSLPKTKTLVAPPQSTQIGAPYAEAAQVETIAVRSIETEVASLQPALMEPSPEQPVSRTVERATPHLVRGVARKIWSAGRTSIDVTRRTRAMLRSPEIAARNIVRSMVDKGDITFFGLNGTAARQLLRLQWNAGICQELVHFGERSSLEREGKLKYLRNIISDRKLDRGRFFREMIRLERLLGDDLIAATYGLRIIRWLGHDKFHLLGFIQDTLKQHGFAREAEVAHAMYDDPEHAEERCRALLDDQLQRHRLNADRPWEIIDDRRGQKTYRVSVVVSLYNPATKLPTFWEMLQQQSMFRLGEAEVVFVDSGSPSNEHAVFQELSSKFPLPAVFARSEKRETIQTAWNRGINLTSGAYLAFLGVDEGVHPDCLRILAEELDKDSSVDWVMADSIVTEVDRKDIFDHDVMLYDRTGYRHDWHYLDCTFLSYVGGLYRRNIHDRFGYYDESFRAAGDTEFKNRILPHIKSRYVALPLGVFNNYPEERTTQHPRAEIEDLRAWYLHRTPAGVSYAFDSRPVEDVVELLKDTFAYRKCYCQHTSTDIDLADALSVHLARRPDGAQWRGAEVGVRAILETFRGFELLQYADNSRYDQLAFVRDYRKIQRLSKDLSRDLGMKKPPGFDVFHDNRYEQHWWSWRT